jgi:hypothetical protein
MPVRPTRTWTSTSSGQRFGKFGPTPRGAGLLTSPRPAIEAANAAAPTFARVYPEMVLFAESTRPLPLAPKGTVLRGATLALYAPDIDRLYADLEGGRMRCYTPPPRSWADADVLAWVVDLATKVGGRAIDPNMCLFNQGFDRYVLLALGKAYLTCVPPVFLRHDYAIRSSGPSVHLMSRPKRPRSTRSPPTSLTQPLRRWIWQRRWHTSFGLALAR